MNNTKTVEKRLAKYWDTILLWSGYDAYYTIEEIARIQKVRTSTITRRIEWFKKHFPDKYEKIKDDRSVIRSASLRMDQQLADMREGNFVSYDTIPTDIIDDLVKEKY